MLEALEKLLTLQERDRRLLRLRAELADIEPQRRLVQNRRAAAEQEFERSKTRGHQLESDRKKLELDVEARKALIAKYTGQQSLTRKNEEYKALTHEIEMCEAAIRELDDQQIAIMEHIEDAERQTAAASEVLKKARADADVQLQQFALAEERLRKQLSEAEKARSDCAASVDPGVLARYERILKNRGDKVVVDVQRGVCGGCHMKLARQEVINTQANREIINCPNCGRILYYLPGMDVTAVE